MFFKSARLLAIFPVVAVALLGEFKAQCRDDGEYSPVQCHQSTGYCWCVDAHGNELEGTRVRGETPTCEFMTPCRLLKFNTKPLPGAYIPSCESDGSFSRVQCHSSTGHCWCSDHSGTEIVGTRLRGTPKCDSLLLPEPKTACHQWLDATPAVLGTYRPVCDERGEFVPRQCHGSTGMCWCVDTLGNEIPETRTRAPSLPHCNRVTECEVARDGPAASTAMTVVGQFQPDCLESGAFNPMQCHGSTGHCWCVDMDGNELPGTRAFANPPTCEVMTPCRMLKFTTKPLPGAFIPACEVDGAFSRVQCHSSTGHCWCADGAGREIEGTRVRGTPSCDSLDIPLPKSKCHQWSASVPAVLGAYRPQCDDSGEFFPLQCHGSSGSCWCVDTDGNEVDGTRTRSPNVPQCPRISKCQRLHEVAVSHRTRLGAAAPAISSARTPCLEKFESAARLPGSFVPQCTESGEYAPLQCHHSTGYCWCVNTQGLEVANTRVRFSQPQCVRVEAAPAAVVTADHATVSRAGIPGRFTAQCRADGEYNPVQCHHSTGYCWCVDADGNELPGTRARRMPECMFMTPCRLLAFQTKPMPGAFIPSCEPDGSFARTQCHWSTGHCWCVDHEGAEISGTRLRGTPDCLSLTLSAPRTRCQKLAALTVGLRGAYTPQCTEDGEFVPSQYHGSTGMSWCVDSKGNEIPNTRVRSPNVAQCVATTPCLLARDGYPVAGDEAKSSSSDSSSNSGHTSLSSWQLAVVVTAGVVGGVMVAVGSVVLYRRRHTPVSDLQSPII